MRARPVIRSREAKLVGGPPGPYHERMGTRRVLAGLALLPFLTGTLSAELASVPFGGLGGRFALPAGGVECAGEVRPDRAVIVGGVSAESLRPGEAREQIDRQVAEIRKLVTQQGGTLALGERVRAVRAVPKGRRESPAEPQPFLMVQRLEVALPTTVDVDQVLDGLLRLGLDRFGRSLRIEAADSSPRVVVRYRFSALRDALEEIHQECKARALRQWCEASTPAAELAGCPTAVAKLLPLVDTQALALQSQPVLSEQGGAAPLVFAYPWQPAQLAAVDLIGDVPLRLTGAIVVALPPARP